MSFFSSSSTNHESESISNNRNPSWIYDVFLSFRDKDPDKYVASRLYTAFRVSGVHVFKDDNELRIGDQITPSVLHAIEGSDISVIVFSSNYADSRWCMQEMEKIMECHRTIGQVVVPVFYDVDPSDVRYQKSMFGEAFKALAERILNKDELMRYRVALTEACNISELAVRDLRIGIKDIEDVLQHVTHLLDTKGLFIADHLVGVEDRVQDVIQLLNNKQSGHTVLVGIWGMGGIGKTTIAKAIYNQMSCGFDAKCFLQNVGELSEQSGGQVSLQQHLLSDILKMKVRINTIESGIVMLRDRVKNKRIFLVLDDVRTFYQLNALCGNREWFDQGSRIVITTRDIQILRLLEVDYVYPMKEMDNNNSLELFSWRAFNNSSPKEDYVELSRIVVEYCGGLPLALEVIGSYLQARSKMEWKAVLGKLEIIPHKIIMEKLKISFDSLGEDEKKIFLDIGSLFFGMDQGDVIQILKSSGHFAETITRVLIDKCLVTVDHENRIGMHSLVRGMGREIIRQKSMSMAEKSVYDVFLSFRGEDGRAKFISHLYFSLQNAGIYVFRDDDEIQRGDQISVSLLQGIRESRTSIIVLTRNYANSKWCMLELEEIMENRRTRGLVVVPVFYEVDPSEVRHQTGLFGAGFEDLISTITLDEYTKQNWKRALLEVGGIAGVVVVNTK